MKTIFCAKCMVLLGLFTVGLLVHVVSGVATAQQVRTYEKNGILYQERETLVRRPIATMETREQSQLVHRLHVTNETHDTYRRYVVPVTQHQWVTQMHGRWNPFVQPYYSQKMVPVTRWESRTEVVPVQTTRRQWIPEVQKVQVQVPAWRMTEEKVVSTVAMGVAPKTNAAPTAVATRTQVGGTSSLQGAPGQPSGQWGSRGTLNGTGATHIRR